MQKSERIASFLLKSLRKANRAYDLIAARDRIAIGVSGGKDSQTLLRLLARWQTYAPFPFQIVAVHINMAGVIPGAPDIAGDLTRLFESLQVPFAIRPLVFDPGEPRPVNCFRCSWNRRKLLFQTACELDCNKVALGHHADDIAETTMLNLFMHGRLESMAPRTEMFDGQITLIRPLALIEEKDIVYYARAAGFFQDAYCCPNGETSMRAEMKTILHELHTVAPKSKINLFRAVERASNWRGHGEDDNGQS